jgi:hypothetical protein
MLKPFIQIYPVLPAKDEAERAALRPINFCRGYWIPALALRARPG